MTILEVEVKPLLFRRNLLKRRLLTRVPYVDYRNPVESLAGFSATKTEFDLLKLYKIFTDISGALLGEEKLNENPGERLLGCANCAMREVGNRPYLSPRDERHEGQGFSDSWAVLCFGLMASNRPPDSEIPCLKVLNGEAPIKLQFEVVED